jgi:hypothetical protein
MDGSYGAEVKDISSFFKSPMMFITAEKPHLAEKILAYINKSFLKMVILAVQRN